MLEFTTPTLQHISYKNGKIAYREMGEGPVLFLLPSRPFLIFSRYFNFRASCTVELTVGRLKSDTLTRSEIVKLPFEK